MGFEFVRSCKELTPVYYNKALGVWFKRDDLFNYNGALGGKARTCLMLAKEERATGLKSLVTYASRKSPQQNYAALVAEGLGVHCSVHIPYSKEETMETRHAVRHRATIHKHKPGYLNNLQSYAKAEVLNKSGYVYIPFGMDCLDAVTYTAYQVNNVAPLIEQKKVKTIVMVLGSGVSASGVIWGLFNYFGCLPSVKIVGVSIGKDPKPVFGKYLPQNVLTELSGKMQIIKSPLKYAEPFMEQENYPVGFELDPYYEAKCLPYLPRGSLFWVVSKRPELTS